MVPWLRTLECMNPRVHSITVAERHRRHHPGEGEVGYSRRADAARRFKVDQFRAAHDEIAGDHGSRSSKPPSGAAHPPEGPQRVSLPQSTLAPAISQRTSRRASRVRLRRIDDPRGSHVIPDILSRCHPCSWCTPRFCRSRRIGGTAVLHPVRRAWPAPPRYVGPEHHSAAKSEPRGCFGATPSSSPSRSTAARTASSPAAAGWPSSAPSG